MKHYIQLKDGIVFNYHQSPDNVDDSGPNVWLVEEEASDKLGMKYDPNKKIFSEAPILRYATLNEENVIILINETKFSSDIKEEHKILEDDNIQVLWQWDGTKFIDVIEKNNMEQNKQYIESLDKLEKENQNSSPKPGEFPIPVIEKEKFEIIHNDELITFNTQADMDKWIADMLEEDQIKMQKLLEEAAKNQTEE